MTSDEYRAYMLRRMHKDRNRVPINPAKPEKHKGDGQRQDVDRSEGKTVDEPGRRRFAVTIEMSFPDSIRRDLDGIGNTILDVIIASRRRLMALYPELEDHGQAGEGRKADVSDNH